MNENLKIKPVLATYRQGDILIVPASLPEKKFVRSTNVIIYGEATGHAHKLDNGKVFDAGEEIYLLAKEGAKLLHDEHDTIELPEGEYRVIRQREYDEKQIRYVAD